MGYNSTTFSKARMARNACDPVKKSKKKVGSSAKSEVVFSGNFNDLMERFPTIMLIDTPTIGVCGIEFTESKNYELLEHAATNAGKLTRVRFRVLNRYYQDGILIKPGIHEFAV